MPQSRAFILFFLLFTLSAASQEKQPNVVHIKPNDTLMGLIKGSPVAPFGEPIFMVYSNLGPYPPRARAKAISAKIKELSEDMFFNPDSLYLMEYEGTYNIVYRDNLVSTVVANDSVAEKKSKLEIASYRMEKISEAISKNRQMHSKENILKSVIFSTLIIILLIFFFFVVNRLFRFFENKISSWQGTKKKVFFILNYEFFDKNRQIMVLSFLNKLLRITLFLLLVIVGLLLMFYILPWTKSFTLQIFRVILSPLKGFLLKLLSLVPNLLTIAIIIVIMTYVNRFFRFLKTETEKGVLRIPGFYPEWALPTYNIIRVIVWIFTFIILWPYIPGSDSKIFQGISVFLGLVFSLTSASLVSNLMAGFTLTYTRAFRMGDRIKIGEMMGDVIEKSMLVTKIKTIKNEEITIPNSKIMGSEVINYSAEAPEFGLILNTTITIGYDAPWRQVHELLIKAALSTEGILKNPKPFVFQTSLDDYYISYQINAYTKKPNEMAKIYSDLHQNIQDKFNEGGVEIMSPAYRSIRDGNETTIPPEYREKGYEAPNFRVKEV